MMNKRHMIHLGRSIEPSMLACVLIINGNEYDQSWYAKRSESSLLLHAIKHVLWTMSKANSRQRMECRSEMLDLLFVPVLHDDIFKL